MTSRPYPSSPARTLLARGAGILLTLAALSMARAATPPPPARIDWSEDLAVLRRELPARHKNLFFRTDGATFERSLATLESAWPHLDDAEVAWRLQECIVAMGDDHSGLTWSPPPGAPARASLPLGLFFFADGWRVLAADRAHENLLGEKIASLGGVPMAEVESRIARLLSLENPWLVKSRLPQMITQPAVLRHCGLALDDALVITTAADRGGPHDTKLSFESSSGAAGLVRFQPRKAAETYANQRAILWHKILPAEGIFLLQYNRCEGREVAERRGDAAAAARLPSLAGLFAGALSELQAAVESGRVRALVVDLRFNPGGASDFGTRFASQVAQIAKLHERGRVYVIIGRRTFSSAILNTGDFQRLLGARLVGEPTSGTRNHYGEVQTFTLPSSRAIVSYSTKYFGTPGGRIEPLRPDIAAEMSFADFAAGIDPAIEAIKAILREPDATASQPQVDRDSDRDSALGKNTP